MISADFYQPTLSLDSALNPTGRDHHAPTNPILVGSRQMADDKARCHAFAGQIVDVTTGQVDSDGRGLSNQVDRERRHYATSLRRCQ